MFALAPGRFTAATWQMITGRALSVPAAAADVSDERLRGEDEKHFKKHVWAF